MKKILVTTDFSENSKAAIRFALKLAAQKTFEFTFFHVHEVLKPTIWKDQIFETFEANEFEKIKTRISDFITAVAEDTGPIPQDVKFAVGNFSSASKGIIEYAEKHGFDFICTSTHGEGKFQLLIGSTADRLIKKSGVPLITVPANYTANETKSVLYATDFSNIQSDIKIVTEFSAAIQADLGLLYFQVPGDPNLDKVLMQQTLKNLSDYPIKIHLKDAAFATPLVESIQAAIKEINPSILIMFTDQEKGFLENLLFPSFTKSYMSEAGIPLVIFKKQSKAIS